MPTLTVCSSVTEAQEDFKLADIIRELVWGDILPFLNCKTPQANGSNYVIYDFARAL